jgi:hypothetical protein
MFEFLCSIAQKQPSAGQVKGRTAKLEVDIAKSNVDKPSCEYLRLKALLAKRKV